jgi:2-polyprenyl-3-methyl-5-hydroxy-6-metoxy-1,4-benzoquinol methylase
MKPQQSELLGYESKPRCISCGAEGHMRHPALEDRLYEINGSWCMFKCTNAACDLHWLNPAPLPELLPSFYAQYHTHSVEPVGGIAKRLFVQSVNAFLSAKYGYQNTITTIGRMGRWLIQLLPTLRDDAAARVYWLQHQEHGKLLEVGFGNGVTLARLKNFGWDVEGVEFDTVSVNLARSLGLEAHLGSIEDVAYPAGTFDAVVASHLIEHLPDPAGFLRECRRVLTEGGRLVLTTPNASSLGHRLFAANWRGLEPPRHLHVFGPKALTMLARDAGFKEIQVTTTARSGSILAQSLRLARKTPPSGAGRLEIEIAALLGWLFSLFGGALSGEELRLECRV